MQRAEGRERMVKRLRNQRVRGYDQGAAAFGRMDRNGILLRIERLLPLHCLPQFIVGFRERNGTDPGHGFQLPSTPYTLAAAVANSWKMLRAQRDFIAAPLTQSAPGAGSITLSRDRMQEGSDAARYPDNHRQPHREKLHRSGRKRNHPRHGSAPDQDRPRRFRLDDLRPRLHEYRVVPERDHLH